MSVEEPNKPVTAAEAAAYLWHYTDLRGIEGIISKAQLWASNLRYVNDASEMRYWLQVVVSAFNEVNPNIIDETFGGAAELEKYLARFNVYACSFSKKQDDLSQWRAYGGQTHGFALGFDETLLRATFKNTFRLDECIYAPDATRRIIKEYAMTLLPLISAIPDKEEQHKYIYGRRNERYQMYGFTGGAPLLKHKKFISEEEYRAIYSELAETAFEASIERGFHITRSLLVPHVVIEFERSGAQAPLKMIQVGPGPHTDLMCASIESLLAHAKFEGVRVAGSEIPLRNW